MKTFEVRLVEVYHVEAENAEEAIDLASMGHYEPEKLTDEQHDRIDYRHGDDSVEEI